MENFALRFIRWGTGLLVIGLLTGYGPLGHYLMGGVKVSCPWAPIHGHVGLLGWMGMTLFGLVYLVIPRWTNTKSPSLLFVKAHFYVCIAAILGVFGNGILGYRFLDLISPSFYYIPNKQILNLWLAIDGIFLSLYGVGCILFMVVVFQSTEYTKLPRTPIDRSTTVTH